MAEGFEAEVADTGATPTGLEYAVALRGGSTVGTTELALLGWLTGYTAGLRSYKKSMIGER